MARCTPILMVILALLPLYYTLDCRKFSFAPACRGIMLKRSGAHAIMESAQDSQKLFPDKSRDLQLFTWLLRAIEEEDASKSDCINVNWLREKIFNAKLDHTHTEMTTFSTIILLDFILFVTMILFLYI